MKKVKLSDVFEAPGAAESNADSAEFSGGNTIPDWPSRLCLKNPWPQWESAYLDFALSYALRRHDPLRHPKDLFEVLEQESSGYSDATKGNTAYQPFRVGFDLPYLPYGSISHAIPHGSLSNSQALGIRKPLSAVLDEDKCPCYCRTRIFSLSLVSGYTEHLCIIKSCIFTCVTSDLVVDLAARLCGARSTFAEGKEVGEG
jgi:hypothetical protein